MRPIRLAVLAAAALLTAASGCRKAAPPELSPQNRLETYAFDPSSPLESRVAAPPPVVLDFMRAFDERPGYSSYAPTAADKAMVLEYLRLLPPVYESVFKARCVGVYFIPDMLGNGLTEWVAGPDGRIYFLVVLDKAVLKKGISETLTGRERSCFIPEAGWSVSVDAGGRYKGLLYALAHEAAHGLDYVFGLSPYVDESVPARYRRSGPDADRFYTVWDSYSSPRRSHDFPGRDRITFYGFNGGPKLRVSEAPGLYRALLSSDFVSLYGARSWAEDMAEEETFSTIAGDLRQPYLITVKHGAQAWKFMPAGGKAAGRSAELRRTVSKIRLPVE